MGIFARKPKREENTVGYELEGRMQEICSCKTFCPCWAGLDPDGGTCGFSFVFHFDRGHINGVEVAGINMAFLGHLPGNIFDGGIRVKVLVDERATDAQQEQLLAAFTGKVGGPLADLAGLIGEIVGGGAGPDRVRLSTRAAAGSAPGTCSRARSKATGRSNGHTDHAQRRRPVGPVLGSPAYPGKIVRDQVRDDQHGLQLHPRWRHPDRVPLCDGVRPGGAGPTARPRARGTMPVRRRGDLGCARANRT